MLTQILYVVGSSWVGTAAKLGSSQMAYWLLAMASFYIPQAAVVIYLNRRLPLEGGLYQWVKVAFGERTGFLVAWNLWVYTVVLIAAYALGIANTLAYALGPLAASVTGTVSYELAVTAGLIALMTLVSMAGLGVGKWVHNAGGLTQLAAFAALLIAPLVALAHHSLAPDRPAALATMTLPAVSVFSVNIFSKLALGALSGFEYVAILAGESRRPARSIGQSVVIATPIIALMFVGGTAAVLAVVPFSTIDLISPIPQTLRAAYATGGAGTVGALLAPTLITLLLVRQVANVNLLFTGNTRLPVVAAWDGLLPGWFTRLHPRFRTPVNSIVFAGALIFVFGAMSLVGAGRQEAFQVLDSASGVLYALTYAAMFAIPLAGARALGVRAPAGLRVAAASGFMVTVLYIVMSVIPIVAVTSRLAFAAKIAVTVVGANLVGLAVLRTAHRRP